MNATPARPWRTLATVSWIGIVLCQVAVAVTSRNIGKSTWWLGPEANPRFPLVWAAPFVVTLVALAATQRPRKYTVAIHAVCVVLLAAIATGDLEGSPGVAVLQFGIALIALLTTFVSLAARP